MKYMFVFLLMPFYSLSQQADTLNGFAKKTAGEEINYFSPLHQFAKTALLTRVNGEMPISWESPVYKGAQAMVTYQFLLGHSTGTSSGERHFDVTLNGRFLFTVTTPMHQTGNYRLNGSGTENIAYLFIQQEYDANADAFGKLYITVPAAFVAQQASFTIQGRNENSRDWLMIFMYEKGLKILVQPTNLVTRKENKRQLNIFIDNPYADNTPVEIKTRGNNFSSLLRSGYNQLHFAAYDPGFTGKDLLQCIVNKKDTLLYELTLSPVKNFVFNIIHHSHNDIGYSHLQTEVEQIQNRNIKAALRWIRSSSGGTAQPAWHIESLWAVENFLRIATAAEEKEFVTAVKKGQLVLSANYANILTGLCQEEELNWVFEYAKQLEKKYGFRILNGMITDIPGISRSGLGAYVNNDILYLSLGPNYVESLADKGDRVGGVIREQGDRAFYWKPENRSAKKLLVWTAGKGYSFFHGIAESEKQVSWEKRISEYCNELTAENYPYDIVQLRYTKNSDNGPVDTLLTQFIEHWNQEYSVPQLKLNTVDKLFAEFENKYGSTLPVYTGEISPYWEDGAYSTAVEEMSNRQLAIKTIAMEKKAKASGRYEALKPQFYLLHKNILLFHEHTWGAWCSISDPESPFTKDQWKIKKLFLDSAVYYYDQLAALLKYTYKPEKNILKNILPITGFTVDEQHGGLSSIIVNGKNIVASTDTGKFFEPIYVPMINPMSIRQTTEIMVKETANNAAKRTVQVTGLLPSIPAYSVTYTLYKKEGRLVCHFIFDKLAIINKESLHIALPFNFAKPTLSYGNKKDQLNYPADQLAGSNKEFVCVEENIQLQSGNITATISSPAICLYEIGGIINEDKTNGAKIWKRTAGNPSRLFLYVFNNYWHTNYKAYQDGHFDFEVELRFNNK